MLNQDNLSFFYFGIENMHKKISIEQSKISDGINFVENGLAELKIDSEKIICYI